MSTWNKKNFSIYTSDERSALGLIEELGNQTNYNTEEIEKVKESDNKKVSHQEMQDTYKIDKNANFTGSWHGIEKPTASQEGLQTIVDKIVEEDIPSINSQLDTIAFEKVNEEFVTKKIAEAKLEGAGVDTSSLVFRNDIDEELMKAEKRLDLKYVRGNIYGNGTFDDNTKYFRTKDVINFSKDTISKIYIKMHQRQKLI